MVTEESGPSGPLIKPYPDWSYFNPDDCESIMNVYRIAVRFDKLPFIVKGSQVHIVSLSLDRRVQQVMGAGHRISGRRSNQVSRQIVGVRPEHRQTDPQDHSARRSGQELERRDDADQSHSGDRRTVLSKHYGEKYHTESKEFET